MVEYWWQQVFWQYFKGAGGCRAISVEPNHRPGSFAAALDVSCRSDPIPTFPLTPAPIIEQHKIRPSPIFGVLKLDNTQCLESARNRMLNSNLPPDTQSYNTELDQVILLQLFKSYNIELKWVILVEHLKTLKTRKHHSSYSGCPIAHTQICKKRQIWHLYLCYSFQGSANFWTMHWKEQEQWALHWCCFQVCAINTVA